MKLRACWDSIKDWDEDVFNRRMGGWEGLCGQRSYPETRGGEPQSLLFPTMQPLANL